MEKNENGLSVRRAGEPGDMMTPSCSEDKRQLAMVYSPAQAFRMLYTPEQALRHGTLFEELNKPFGGYRDGQK